MKTAQVGVIATVQVGAATLAKLIVCYDGTFSTTKQRFGISMHAADASAYCSCAVTGIAPVIADGAISAGAAVYSSATGYATGAGTVIIGYALDAASADGDVIRIRIGV